MCLAGTSWADLDSADRLRALGFGLLLDSSWRGGLSHGSMDRGQAVSIHSHAWPPQYIPGAITTAIEVSFPWHHDAGNWDGAVGGLRRSEPRRGRRRTATAIVARETTPVPIPISRRT